MFASALTQEQQPSESAARAKRFAEIRTLAKTRLRRDYEFGETHGFSDVREAYVHELRTARRDLYPTRLEWLERQRHDLERSDGGLLGNPEYQRICDEIRKLKK